MKKIVLSAVLFGAISGLSLFFWKAYRYASQPQYIFPDHKASTERAARYEEVLLKEFSGDSLASLNTEMLYHLNYEHNQEMGFYLYLHDKYGNPDIYYSLKGCYMGTGGRVSRQLQKYYGDLAEDLSPETEQQ